MMQKSCKTCRWAEWQRTDKGNIRWSAYGKCTVKFEFPIVPQCVGIKLKQDVIWKGSGTDCQFHEAQP